MDACGGVGWPLQSRLPAWQHSAHTRQETGPVYCIAALVWHASPRPWCGKDGSAVQTQAVCTTLLPALLELCGDPIAAVRRAAAQQVGRVFCTAGLLAPDNTPPQNGSAQDVAAQVCSLARSSAFQRRISYAHAFSSIVQHASQQDVCMLFVPSFTELANDSVLDVRLATLSVLSAMAELYGHEMPCSPHDAAAVMHMQPGVWAVLNDMRLREAVSLATADSDTVVAQTACVCQKHLSNVLCSDA